MDLAQRCLPNLWIFPILLRIWFVLAHGNSPQKRTMFLPDRYMPFIHGWISPIKRSIKHLAKDSTRALHSLEVSKYKCFVVARSKNMENLLSDSNQQNKPWCSPWKQDEILVGRLVQNRPKVGRLNRLTKLFHLALQVYRSWFSSFSLFNWKFLAARREK